MALKVERVTKAMLPIFVSYHAAPASYETGSSGIAFFIA